MTRLTYGLHRISLTSVWPQDWRRVPDGDLLLDGTGREQRVPPSVLFGSPPGRERRGEGHKVNRAYRTRTGQIPRWGTRG